MMDIHIEQWRVILLELYVRGLTADMNELELLKVEKDCDENRKRSSKYEEQNISKK